MRKPRAGLSIHQRAVQTASRDLQGTRHKAAHSMEKVGLTVSEIKARLGHRSLATTGRYLAGLRRAENRKADELAALYGIE